MEINTMQIKFRLNYGYLMTAGTLITLNNSITIDNDKYYYVAYILANSNSGVNLKELVIYQTTHDSTTAVTSTPVNVSPVSYLTLIISLTKFLQDFYMGLNAGIKLYISNASNSRYLLVKYLRVWNTRKNLNQLLATKGSRINSEFYNNLIYNIDFDNNIYTFNYVRQGYEPNTEIATLNNLYDTFNNYYFKSVNTAVNTNNELILQVCDQNQVKLSSGLIGYPCKSINIIIFKIHLTKSYLTKLIYR